MKLSNKTERRDHGLELVAECAKPQTRTFFVYLIHCEGFYKIGWSENVPVRIACLQAANPFPVTLVRALAVSDIVSKPRYDFSLRYTCRRLEAYLHDRFAQHRVHGEWFNLPQDAVHWLSNIGLPDLAGLIETRCDGTLSGGEA